MYAADFPQPVVRRVAPGHDNTCRHRRPPHQRQPTTNKMTNRIARTTAGSCTALVDERRVCFNRAQIATRHVLSPNSAGINSTPMSGISSAAIPRCPAPAVPDARHVMQRCQHHPTDTPSQKSHPNMYTRKRRHVLPARRRPKSARAISGDCPPPAQATPCDRSRPCRLAVYPRNGQACCSWPVAKALDVTLHQQRYKVHHTFWLNCSVRMYAAIAHRSNRRNPSPRRPVAVVMSSESPPASSTADPGDSSAASQNRAARSCQFPSPSSPWHIEQKTVDPCLRLRPPPGYVRARVRNGPYTSHQIMTRNPVIKSFPMNPA